ncbi:MAG: acyl carrier protein [Acidobacteriota bacterium]
MAEPRADILAAVREIAATELEVEGNVELHHELARDLELDSVGAIVLAVGLEDRFRVKLSDKDAEAIVTVAGLIELVERKLAERESVPSPGEQGLTP